MTDTNTLNSDLQLLIVTCRCLSIAPHTVFPQAGLTHSLLFLCVFSGPSWPAEMALQHQPAAAEPPSADEGGRWRGRQGQKVIRAADDY